MTLEQLIHTSLQQLKQMHELVVSLAEKLENHSSSSVTRFNSQFCTLQQQAQHTDKLLEKSLENTRLDSEILLLLEQRRTLQKQILTALKHVLPQANSLKTLLRSEMQAVKQGRNALNGYNTCAEHRKSRIINTRY